MIVVPFISDALKRLKVQDYDDCIDRINYYATPILFLFFSIVVSAKQYIGEPIQCWCPAEFRGGWEEYTEDYCFIQNTYYVPMNEDIPNDVENRKQKEIGYYQWVPIVLALQALLFVIPNFFWKGLCFQSGLNLKTVLKKAKECSNMQDLDGREKELLSLTRYLSETLGIQRQYGVGSCRRFLCVRCGKRFGSYVSSLYLFTKFLYVCNVVGQFFLLNAFLGTNYTFWGVEIMNDLIRGREWQQSGHFPRVTLCDVKIRKMGNIHNYSFQCVLMMNMFNEKIYLFVWFWLFAVGVITCLNFLYWMLTLLPGSQRDDFVGKYLRYSRPYGDERSYDDRLLRRFVRENLRPDGILALRFVGTQAGEFIAMNLARNLWLDFTRARYPKNIEQPIGQQQSKVMVDVDTGSDSTKSTSPDRDGEFHETLYDPVTKKQLNGGLSTPLLPSAPAVASNGYPGPPALPPKPKLADV